jgi:hypothetical protein
MIRTILYFAALVSIIGSVAVYNLHSETLGTFIGLWVPTLLLLSNRPCPWSKSGQTSPCGSSRSGSTPWGSTDMGPSSTTG